MQAVFEKIIERLKSRKDYLLKEFVLERAAFGVKENALARINEEDYAIEIINQVAEEYNQDLTNDRWIPFTLREADVEEKEAFGCETMLDCKLPEDGEEIFVTYKFKDEFYVCGDTFMRDGSACYLESGLDFVSEAIAWQPLPEPYNPENACNTVCNSKQLESGWIPCSNRLPEEHKLYDITTRNDAGIHSDSAIWCPQRKAWYWDAGESIKVEIEVLAWAEKREPYREERR